MFLEGVLHQLEAFAMSAGVNNGDVLVRITLADGESVTVRGLKTSDPFAGSSWGMIHGVAGAGPGEVLVVREEHVLKAQFQLEARSTPPIGFEAETQK